MLVDSLLKAGQSLYRVQWSKGKTTFNTLAVFDGDDLVYDNMISNTFIPKKVTSDSTPTHGQGYDCFDPYKPYKIIGLWLFGLERARAEIDIFLDCECKKSSCEVFDTKVNKKAYMQIGSAQATVKWLTSPNKAKCVKYVAALSWETPLVSVDLKFDTKIGEFAVKVSGIGSHCVEQFTNTLCCDKTGCQL